MSAVGEAIRDQDRDAVNHSSSSSSHAVLPNAEHTPDGCSDDVQRGSRRQAALKAQEHFKKW